MSDTWATWHQYWDLYTRAFAQPLQANGLLSDFVTNANVTGAYAEAWIRSTTRNMLGHRFRISTGAVIRATDRSKTRGTGSVCQCDLIVWDPSEMPAIFESSEFALVPLFAARAIIEVKRTGGKDKREELTKQLNERQNLLPVSQMNFVLGVIVNDDGDPRPLFSDEHKPSRDWLEEHWLYRGVPPVTRILCNNEPDTNGIMAFIYFLAQVASWKR